MLTIEIALVPFEKDFEFREDVLTVAAALQIQLARDVAPLWGVTATISAFRSFEDAPSSYLPIFVSRAERIDTHGFHLARNGIPFGFVRYDEQTPQDWTLAASHELLELVCDPSGTKTVPGPSLRDEKHDLGAAQRQGEVDYLVEVCDPCEDSFYEIDGVVVSDFVTPRFYDAVYRRGVSYSFLGTIERPRQLLQGGYIAWKTRRDGQIWKAAAEPSAQKQDTADEDKPARPADAGEATSDTGPRRYETDELQIAQLRPRPEPEGPPHWFEITRPSPADAGAPATKGSLGKANEPYAEQLRKDIAVFIAFARARDTLTLDDLVTVLEKLAAKQPLPDEVVTRVKLSASNSEITADQLQEIINKLKLQHQIADLFGQDMFNLDFAGWLMVLRD